MECKSKKSPLVPLVAWCKNSVSDVHERLVYSWPVEEEYMDDAQLLGDEETMGVVIGMDSQDWVAEPIRKLLDTKTSLTASCLRFISPFIEEAIVKDFRIAVVHVSDLHCLAESGIPLIKGIKYGGILG